MKNPTFREQYDKVVSAYLKNELKPMNTCACFIGNMLNGASRWYTAFDSTVGCYSTSEREDGFRCLREEANDFYTPKELYQLEKLFLQGNYSGDNICSVDHADYEDRLYRAMERTLLRLRGLHEAKGEVIEDYSLTRRELVS